MKKPARCVPDFRPKHMRFDAVLEGANAEAQGWYAQQLLWLFERIKPALYSQMPLAGAMFLERAEQALADSDFTEARACLSPLAGVLRCTPAWDGFAAWLPKGGPALAWTAGVMAPNGQIDWYYGGGRRYRNLYRTFFNLGYRRIINLDRWDLPAIGPSTHVWLFENFPLPIHPASKVFEGDMSVPNEPCYGAAYCEICQRWTEESYDVFAQPMLDCGHIWWCPRRKRYATLCKKNMQLGVDVACKVKECPTCAPERKAPQNKHEVNPGWLSGRAEYSVFE